MRITIRDREILRTLARVQVANTASLSVGFFTHRRIAQRRLASLREEGLIASHRRGLPMHGGAGILAYWHLTDRGYGVIEHAFPDEPVPAGGAHAASRLSVRNFEHRDACADLYIRLIRDMDQRVCRDKADRVSWRPDGAVTLGYRWGRHERVVVPDAVAWAERGSARIFVELDRSTETLRRCREVAQAYETCALQDGLAGLFADARTPYVLYLTKTRIRRDHLREVFAAVGAARVRLAAFCFEEGVGWLHEALFGDGFDLARVGDVVRDGAVARTLTQQLGLALEDLHRDVRDRLAEGELPASVSAAEVALADWRERRAL